MMPWLLSFWPVTMNRMLIPVPASRRTDREKARSKRRFVFFLHRPVLHPLHDGHAWQRRGQFGDQSHRLPMRASLASAMGISRTSLGAGRSVYELNSKSTSAMKLIRTRQGDQRGSAGDDVAANSRSPRAQPRSRHFRRPAERARLLPETVGVPLDAGRNKVVSHLRQKMAQWMVLVNRSLYEYKNPHSLGTVDSFRLPRIR